jgi:hypothetical protein
MKVEWFGIFLLSFWTISILFRRWVWDQVPSQISPFLVYALVLLNVCFLIHRLLVIASAAKQSQ